MTKDQQTEDANRRNVVVPNVIGLTYKEAKKCLEEAHLQIDARDSENVLNPEYTIVEQIPCSGVQVLENSAVIVE